MQLDEILAKSQEKAPTPEEALFVFQESRDSQRAMPIFATAASVRDALQGRTFTMCSEVAQITSTLKWSTAPPSAGGGPLGIVVSYNHVHAGDGHGYVHAVH